MQETALLGMWRGKFFEHGAFYGGTALRIIHGLDRFSEDLDFSLLKADSQFDISRYEPYLKNEIESFGFQVKVKKKIKNVKTPIESAFIKANSAVHLLEIDPRLKAHPQRLIKIRLEIDTDPAGGEESEVFQHFVPVPYSIKTFSLPTLFAGRIVASLFRSYKFNVKGRDWYDFLWYTGRDISVNIPHLRAKMIQIGKWDPDRPLTIDSVRQIMLDRIDDLDLDMAKSDILPFVKDRQLVQAWTKDLLRAAAKKLCV
jgi:predicted nucleotidyltransferase component of viral defense system